MVKKDKGFIGFISQYKQELMIGMAILFFIIILLFSKQINAFLKGKEAFNLFSLSPVRSMKSPILRKNEARCREIFESLLGVKFPSARPHFMKRSNGFCLELDGLNMVLKLAWEYNGIQHYKYSPRFHRKDKDFEDQKVRDADKIALCKKAGIELIIIPYTVRYENLESYIRGELKTRGYL